MPAILLMYVQSDKRDTVAWERGYDGVAEIHPCPLRSSWISPSFPLPTLKAVAEKYTMAT